MNFQNKKIGIWGFGIVGKAALNYFYPRAQQVSVMDAKPLNPEDQDLLNIKNIPFYLQDPNSHQFLEHNDFILASPGIDLRPYAKFAHKWLTELDILQDEFHKPIIAVTGSVGKTTITTLLSHIITTQKFPLYTGGNIGAGMLELLSESENFDAALLEVSSFQLEQCHRFAPDLAIWTTFYPNHLDRHGTLTDYFNAKKKILDFQHHNQHALLPWNILEQLGDRSVLHGKRSYFSTTNFESIELKLLHKDESLFYVQNNHLMLFDHTKHQKILDLSALPEITFTENWLIICSALDVMHTQLHLPNFLTKLAEIARTVTLPEHRLEKIATIKNIDFYNDSKSTTPASTLAAVQQLHKKPIVLLLGGLSKGIDRSWLIKDLRGRVKEIYCFGKEAEQLKTWCDEHKIPAQRFDQLEKAFAASVSAAKAHDQILFSPAGSSFDLFKNYQERGACFKELVKKISLD